MNEDRRESIKSNIDRKWNTDEPCSIAANEKIRSHIMSEIDQCMRTADTLATEARNTGDYTKFVNLINDSYVEIYMAGQWLGILYADGELSDGRAELLHRQLLEASGNLTNFSVNRTVEFTVRRGNLI